MKEFKSRQIVYNISITQQFLSQVLKTAKF